MHTILQLNNLSKQHDPIGNLSKLLYHRVVYKQSVTRCNLHKQ